MFRLNRIILFTLILSVPALTFGQTTPAKLTFEVATIKPAPPINPAAILAGQMPHVGMNVQGTRVDIGYMSLMELIVNAFKVRPYQVNGPDWMKTERFDILAKMPDGTTKDDVPQMLQALLTERFGMKVHRDSREDPIYALVVAKGGSKLQEALPDPETPPEPAPGAMTLPNGQGQVQINRNGGATVTTPGRGTTKMSMTPDGHMRLEASKMSMEDLAQALNPLVDHPVFDMTELKGNYQVALELSLDTMLAIARAQGMDVGALGARGAAPGGAPEASDPSGSSSIFASVQQLGLKLEPRKMQLDYVVVDHIEKSPTEN
jgi:uncharacterized protein (TIGR03435 family)